VVGFEQEIAVAGSLCERHQLAGPVARQSRLAPEIGVEPQTPLGLVRRRTVSDRSADLLGAPISILDLGALHAAHDHQSRTKLQKKIQLAAHPLFRLRQRIGHAETRREMRDSLLVSRPAHRQITGPHAVITGGTG
jgi:hypothetical protein